MDEIIINNTDKIFLDRIESLVTYGCNNVLGKVFDADVYSRIPLAEFIMFTTPSLALIEDIFGRDSVYFKNFERLCEVQSYENCDACVSILCSIKEHIKKGWITRYRDLISAEIFTDFMEMADYLLCEGYKDASAVILGSILESNLRKLCDKNSIETTFLNGSGDRVAKRADTLNSDLYKKDVYNKLVQKNITAWLDLRNQAAHGNYSEYSKEEVRLMYSGILNFLSSME